MWKILLALLLFDGGNAIGQTIPQSTAPEVIERALPGDVLVRRGAVETVKAADDTLTSRVYMAPQWNENGAPLLSVDAATRKAVSRGRYVRFIPDSLTASLEMQRTTGNSCTKEFYAIPDSTVTRLSWTVETDAPEVRFAEGSLRFLDTVGAEFLHSPAPVAWDANRNPVDISVEYGDNAITYTIQSGTYQYPLVVDPSVSATTTISEGLYKSDANFGTSRNSPSFVGAQTSSLTMGSRFYSNTYYTFRGFGAFPIPDMSALLSASWFLEGQWNYSTTDIGIYLVSAAFGETLGNEDFGAFDGYHASDVYTGTILNNSWSSSSYSAGWNEITANAAGLTAILSAKNSTFQVAMLSDKDYSATVPPADNYVAFETSNTAGKEPYLSLTYTLPGVTPNRRFTQQDGSPTPTQLNGLPVARRK